MKEPRQNSKEPNQRNNEPRVKVWSFLLQKLCVTFNSWFIDFFKMNYWIFTRFKAKLLQNFTLDVVGEKNGRHYKDYLSDFNTLERKEQSDKWLVFSVNMETYLSIFETSVSNGEIVCQSYKQSGKWY